MQTPSRARKRILPARRIRPKTLVLGLTLTKSACLLFLVAGCPGFARVAAEVVLTPEEEVALGRELAREVEARFDFHPDLVVQRYVQDLGEMLVRASGEPRPEVPWSFKVIDDPDQVNAMALPGGWIYIFSGLMLLVESESEISGVLAHEIAHVNERHIAQRLATIYGIEVLAAVALGRDPGTLERIIATIMAQGYLLNYSRAQEREADALAVDYTINAGWDPRGLADFFEHLTETPRPPTWLATHPSPEDRIANVHELLAGRTIPTRTGRERYAIIRNRVAATAVPEAERRPPKPHSEGRGLHRCR